MDSVGQEGFYDAMLFLMIISVASCLVLSSTLILTKPDEGAMRDAVLEYARASLDSMLSSTLPEAFYEGGDGGRVTLGNNTTVEDYLLLETYLVSQGMQVSAFSDCNRKVEMIARELLTGAYDFSLETKIGGERGFENVFSLGTSDSSAGYSAASDYSVCGESIRIELVLHWA
jgi:hypothetical protein